MTMDDIKSKVRHGVRVMLVSILVGANIATILLLWILCLSTYLEPAIHPRLSQVGLLFPVFLGINLFFILVWFIVSWRWLLLPILGIAVCWSYVRDYCPINLGAEAPEASYTVLSFNVAGFLNDSEAEFDGWKSLDYITNSGADIIFLQECPSSGAVFSRLSHRMDSLGYCSKAEGGVCIFSKWSFCGKGRYIGGSMQGNGAFVCFANVDGDTIMLVNSHLQSNAISQEEKDEYGNAMERYDKNKMTASGRLLLSRLTRAASKRAEQTDILCELIKENEKYSMIVGGDMNDTPISYTFQRISRLLNNAFTESGNGIGISFNRKGFPVRIDHIFTSKDLKTHGTYVDDKIRSSDHCPIVTRVYKSVK